MFKRLMLATFASLVLVGGVAPLLDVYQIDLL